MKSERESVLFYNGSILTMEPGPQPEAVLVRDGRIAAVGGREILELRQPDTRMCDLGGCTLVPSFIDPHSHITAFASTLRLAPLSGAAGFDQLRELLRAFLEEHPPAEGDWLMGFGYDHNSLKEKTHPTRQLLDQVSSEIPILISHASGHMGVANTAALQAAGITADTPDPAGGRIGREQDGREPNGYLEEKAFMAMGRKCPAPSPELQRSLLREAQRQYLRYGITTVQDGLTGSAEWAMLKDAALAGDLETDVVAFVDENACPELLDTEKSYLTYRNRLKIGGYKLVLDGSPQGRTAWLSRPYEPAAEGYSGYPTYRDDQVEAFVRRAGEAGVQLLTHCNGDAASEQLLRAWEKVGGKPGLRPVMIHAQTVRLDQLPRLKALGMIPSFFVAHVYYWGDVHLQNLGMERASRISPAKSALRLEIPFTFHQDTPVLPPDMLETIRCAVLRQTKGGVLLGEDERLTPEEALYAVTRNAAYQYFEEDQKGSIRAGKLADLVVLSDDPRRTEPEELTGIRVLETIKEGKTLYQA